MLRSDRLTSAVRDHGKSAIKASTGRLTSAVHGRKRSLIYVGAALALASAGTASAATVAATTSTPAAATPFNTAAQADTGPHAFGAPADPARAGQPLAGQAPFVPTAPHPAPVHRTERLAVRVRPASAKRSRPQRGQHPASITTVQHARAAKRSGAGNARGARHVAARHGAWSRRPAPRRPTKPYLMYDSVTPSAIPRHHLIATYATGPYAVPAAHVAGRGPIHWIDTNGSDPHASVLDVEPGDATASMAATWTHEKLTADPHAVAHLYTMRSEWPAVQAAVGNLPRWMQNHVRYWIADPTGVPHIVPGSQATQWYWGSSYDISTATPGF
jgi:hypothetical protein